MRFPTFWSIPKWPGVVVPTEYVQDGQIVLNISPSAVRDLSLGNEFVMCSGRFAGRSFEITLPIESIRAIYCRDSGQGLAFEDEDFAAAESLVTEQETSVLNPEVAAEETAVKDGDAEKKAPTCGWSMPLL